MHSRQEFAGRTKDLGSADKGQLGVRDPDGRATCQKTILRHQNAPRLRSGSQFMTLSAFGIGQFIRSGSFQRCHLLDFWIFISAQYSSQQLG
jgi:hypothetical protein